MLRFHPNGDRVVVRPLREEELRGSKFSIIVSGEQTNQEAQQGIIIEAGPEATYKVGDFVIFNSAAGDILRVPDGAMFHEMRLMHSDTVHALFTDE